MQEAEPRFEWVRVVAVVQVSSLTATMLQISQQEENTDLQGSLVCLDASQSTARHRVLVLRSQGARFALSWLDCRSLSLDQPTLTIEDPARLIGVAAGYMLLNHPERNKLRWTAPPEVAQDGQSIAPGIQAQTLIGIVHLPDKQARAAWLAASLAAELLNGQNADDVLRRCSFRFQPDEIGRWSMFTLTAVFSRLMMADHRHPSRAGVESSCRRGCCGNSGGADRLGAADDAAATCCLRVGAGKANPSFRMTEPSAVRQAARTALEPACLCRAATNCRPGLFRVLRY